MLNPEAEHTIHVANYPNLWRSHFSNVPKEQLALPHRLEQPFEILFRVALHILP